MAFVLWRFLILGDLGGGRPATALAGLGLGNRTLVMIPVYLHWLRLAISPAQLRAIYGNPEFGGPPAALALLGGMLAIVALAGVAIWSRKRSPATCLGILWFATASVITSNLLIPTAFLIAERTFMLPSVGLAFIAAGVVALQRGAVRPVAGIGVAILVALGLARSWSRQMIWRDDASFYGQVIVDSPRSYLAHYLAGKHYYRQGETSAALREFERAAVLFGRDKDLFNSWGQLLREQRDHLPAAAVLRRGLALDPMSVLTRSRLIGALLSAGEAREAAATAAEGVALGVSSFSWLVGRLKADEADSSGATPSAGTAVRRRP